MVAALILAAIQIGAIIFLRLITPKGKRPKAAPFEAPNVEEGAAIPKVFGTQQISGTVILVVDKKATLVSNDSKTEYRAKMAYGMCWGPIDVLYDIVFDELALSLLKPSKEQSPGGAAPVTTVPFPIQLTGDAPVKFDITAINLFGGGTEEGGINGEACLYRGTNDQPMDPLIAYGYGGFASRNPHMAYFRFGTAPDLADATTTPQRDQFYWILNNPTPKPISFIVGAYPHALLDLATSLGLNGAYTDHKIGQNANAIEVWFECLTNRVWGKSESPDLFNIAQLCETAERLRAENRGISTTLADRQLDDFIDDVMLHIRAVPVENPETGLLEVHLLRPDYALNDLVKLTKKNTVNFRQSEGHFLETLNQIEVKYRKFDGGTPGPGQTVVTAKFSRNLIDAHTGELADWGVFNVQTDGKNLQNISVSRDRAGDFLGLTQTDHFRGSDYQVHAVDGWFQFYANDADGRLQDGDILTLVYESRPTFSGFIDATATSQNIANLQVTGYTRAETYDYTMFIDEIAAQDMADFLRLMSSRKLALFEWDMTREGSHLHAGDVVLGDELDYRLTGLPIRVTRIRLPSADNPNLHFEGMEDVFGQQIALRSPSPIEGIPPELNQPPTDERVTVTCLGGAIRIGLTATDPRQSIEVIRADDADGTNAVIITPDIGLPGTTTFLDDPQTVGVTKCYRARAVLPPYYSGGDLSPAICCTASADPPSDPSVILPTWAIVPSQTDTEGTAELVVTDPQGRVLSIEVQTQIGIQAPTDYVVITGPPYTATVALISPDQSFIRFRITYVTPTGDVSEVAEAVFDSFVPAPPEIPGGGGGAGGGLLIIVPFHASLTHGFVIQNSPAEWVPIGKHYMRRIDVSSCDQVRLNIQVKRPLPDGAQFACQYVPSLNEHPVEADWKFLTDFGGPIVDADEATDIPRVSAWAALSLEAIQEIIVRPVIKGGDGVADFACHEAFIEFKGSAVGGETPTDPVPDPCQDTTIDFGSYKKVADLNADWTFVPNDFLGSMGLDLNGGEDGGSALVLGASPGVMAGHVGSYAYHDFDTGGHPGPFTVTARMRIKQGYLDQKAAFGGIAEVQAGVSQPGGAGASDLNASTDWVTLTFSDSARYNSSGGSGTTHFRLAFGLGFLPFNTIYASLEAVFARATITASDGTMIGPCTGGPILPPPGGGGPPPPIPPLGPQKLYLTDYQQALWGQYTPFTGALLIVQPNTIMSLLNAAQAAGLFLFTNLVSRTEAMSGGVFSQAAYMQKLNSFSAIGPTAAAHPAFGGIRVLDEPNSIQHWNTSVPVSVVDGVLAKRISEIFPNVPRHLRMRATLIEASGWRPSYIQIATCHYVKREGAIASYMAAERAAAERLSLSIGWGMNPLGGGASPMSPAEVESIGLAMARDTKPFFHISVWAGTPAPFTEYMTSAYLNAFSAVAGALNP